MLIKKLTMATNMGRIPNLRRNVLATLAVGDLEATATLIPFFFSARNTPLASVYRYGDSLWKLHSLKFHQTKTRNQFAFTNQSMHLQNQHKIQKKQKRRMKNEELPIERPESVIEIDYNQTRQILILS